ncbi:hypothetical protein ACFQBQ_17495 [Granulicella cerasi]|uniref:Alg9-like mannosyltransferase family protein n=1 Tax=Granulicella cerasi TaxID=741063 RepID=A0ABW1ZF84_9BACT|nr:hypothetical protein [Granulicella cerasi]
MERSLKSGQTVTQQSPTKVLLFLLLIGFLLRLALLHTPRSFQADETFQYLEQAHRLVFGYGVVPWEYRYGIRSWLVPFALSGPMKLGSVLLPGTAAYLLLPRICLCILSLGSILAAYALGLRLSRAHALAAATVAALWPDFLLFSGQALTDSIAVPFALGAAVLLRSSARWKLVAAGALLALACAIRVQYLPALAAMLLVSLAFRWRDWLWTGLGILAATALSTVPDILLADAPFVWVSKNIHMNLVAHHAVAYGSEGPLFYLVQFFATWVIWTIPLFWLAWIGSRRFPELRAMIVVLIAMHSFIAHKEFRYIHLAMITILLLAAIGTVEWLQQQEHLRYTRWVIACWLLAAFTSVAMPTQTEDWGRAVAGNEAFAAISHDPRTCGVAMFKQWWTNAGGYTYLHRDVPLYPTDRTDNPAQSLWQHQDAFNVILTTQHPDAPLPPAYHRTQCFAHALYNDDDACIWQREGSCRRTGAETLEINHLVGEPDKPKTAPE